MIQKSNFSATFMLYEPLPLQSNTKLLIGEVLNDISIPRIAEGVTKPARKDNFPPISTLLLIETENPRQLNCFNSKTHYCYDCKFRPHTHSVSQGNSLSPEWKVAKNGVKLKKGVKLVKNGTKHKFCPKP